MKKRFLLSNIPLALLCLLLCSSYRAAAAGPDYFPGGSVTDWNLVDYAPGFFESDDFAANLAAMPGDSWIKSTGSTYSDSYCGAIHITKFTTDAGADENAPPGRCHV